MLTAVPRRSGSAGATPLSPERRWRAIALATVLVAPAIWALLAGLVAVAADDGPSGRAAGAAIAFGLSMLPFVFVLLSFMSEQSNPPRAALRAMGLCLLVGLPVSALAGDAVSGIVAGVGAGGIAALRSDEADAWRPRAAALAVATVYAFVLARAAGATVLIAAPVLPFTSLGLADHWAEWRRARSDPDDSGRGGAEPGDE
jgi:hypothetical protein